jgi:hypothetical protein
MKALCAISSVEFTVEHFPGYLSSREVMHPAFHIPQKKLLSYVGQWSRPGAFTETDSYLLFLALLHSTELVHFRVPVYRSEKTPAIIANNMAALAQAVIKINAVTTPSFSFPQFAITPETRYLTNVNHWIEDWEDAYKDFRDGYRRVAENEKLKRRSEALERLIKTPFSNASRKYGLAVAEWAAQAGSFPTFNIDNPYIPGSKCSIGDYWKHIITKACDETDIYSINLPDLIELIEHCEENVPVGTIQSHALFKALRSAKERQRNYLGMGEISLPSGGGYTFISDPSSVESANLAAMMSAAPDKEPKPEEYPTKLAYLRAKMRWELSRKDVSNLPDADSGE